MSDVVRMILRLSQRESRMTQSQINRLVRASAPQPQADPIRPRQMSPVLPYYNVNVYLPRRLLK